MSTAVSNETLEARELGLVSKVELRIALAESDAKLESTLKTYLPPLLLKLASDFARVREKVISVCQHINTRVKPPSIKLPVPALLKQYKGNPNTLIRHFDLLYIQQGVDRLSIDDRLELLPTLLDGLHGDSQESAPRAASLFNLFLKLLHSLKLPSRGSEEDLELRTKLGFSTNVNDAEYVCAWLGKLFLFNVNQADAKRGPGLSTEDYSFLQLYGKKDTWQPTVGGGLNLAETKVLAAKFLASGAFLDSERFLPALFASADANSRLSDVGDDILKRATSAISLEDSSLVEQLYNTYLGTRGIDGSLPARVPLQLKILSLLCRSKQCASFVQQSLQIVQEGLAPIETPGQDGFSGAQKQGLEISKLRAQIFAFTNWLARISSRADIGAFAPVLVSQLREYIYDQGWPRFQSKDTRPSAGDLSSRSYAYESIGLLAAACPGKLLFDVDLDLLRWLFSSLSTDASGKDISFSIEQALSSVLGAFGDHMSPDLEKSLTNLLVQHMSRQAGKLDESGSEILRSTRYIAVRFANHCLPYSNTTARWIDLLAMDGNADERNEIIEEGRKGLDPYWYRILHPPKVKASSADGEASGDKRYQFPAFDDLIEQLFGLKSRWEMNRMEATRHQLVRAHDSAVRFSRNVLLNEALRLGGATPVVDAQWERNIDALTRNDEDARIKVKKYLKDMIRDDFRSQGTLQLLLDASFDSVADPTSEGFNNSNDSILELCALSPDSCIGSLATKISSLQDSILSNKKPLRETAAHVFGLLGSHPKCRQEEVQKILKLFNQKIGSWQPAIGYEVFQVHGAIIATAYLLARISCRVKNYPVYKELTLVFVSSVLDILNGSRDRLLLDGATGAIAELSLFAALSPKSIPAPHTVNSILQKLKERGKAGDEKAITALGHFAIQYQEDETEDSSLNQIVQILYELHEVREAPIQFAVGAAFSCAAIGWRSKFLIAALDFEGSPPQTPERASALSSILEKVLADSRTTKPALRQAVVIWLLCLVQYCGQQQEVQGRLREIQAAFKGFLADRDSLNQESASRGLTLVYEKGDRALKDDLIRDLVGSFIGTRAGLAGSVSEETELFEPGALPTGEGSVTTYKDIMSLASEVGDPSLVYRFMSLASNNAIWSSRAAFGRFGLSNILSDSSVDGYLAQNQKLYPALFRYRFDPNTNVRNSMNDIWTALVKDPSAIIDHHFESILNDLLKNILGKEWRARQACCAAIADLVQGRPLKKYEKYLGQIWTVTLKVCDDIKDSVRQAAMALARVLTGILTRKLEAGDSSAKGADNMLKNVLPFLLSPSGLESSAEEVRAFALLTLLQIIKSSPGKILRPYVPELVGRLTELLSSVEPEEINYFRLNAENYGFSAEELDGARLSAVRASPMMQAIEQCLDFLDESTMKTLELSLENAIKVALGLPSKVGATRILVSLATRHNFVFKNHADHFLKLCRKQVLDRNDTVSSSYAAACGYLARLASNEEILRLIGFAQTLYFKSEDDRHRAISADIIFTLSQHATDRFNALAGDVLPFVFIAKHDPYERAKTPFQDTWNENVGGSRAVLLYLKEIMALASQHLDSSRWSLQHTSAFAIADVITSSGTEISDTTAQVIWPTLEKALAGKTWDGKEKILDSFVKFIKNSAVLKTNEPIASQAQKIIIREVRRRNPRYRPYALASLAEFVELRDSVDLFAQTYEIAEPAIQAALGDDASAMDIDEPNGSTSSKSLVEETLANAVAAIVQSVNPKCLQGPELVSALGKTLEIVEKVMKDSGSRIILNALFSADSSLFAKFHAHFPTPYTADLEDILAGFAKTLFQTQDAVEQTRLKAGEALVAMARLCKSTGSRKLRGVLEAWIGETMGKERSGVVKQTLRKAKEELDA